MLRVWVACVRGRKSESLTLMTASLTGTLGPYSGGARFTKNMAFHFYGKVFLLRYRRIPGPNASLAPSLLLLLLMQGVQSWDGERPRGTFYGGSGGTMRVAKQSHCLAEESERDGDRHGSLALHVIRDWDSTGLLHIRPKNKKNPKIWHKLAERKARILSNQTF